MTAIGGDLQSNSHRRRGPKAESEDHEEYADEKGVRPDEPDERESARGWEHDEHDPEDDRGEAREPPEELDGHALVKAEREKDLGDAGEDRPRRDENDDGQSRQTREDDGDHSGDDAHDPADEHRRRLSGASKERGDREDPVDENVDREKQDQKLEGQARPHERGQAEEDRGDPADGDQPPIALTRGELGHHSAS